MIHTLNNNIYNSNKRGPPPFFIWIPILYLATFWSILLTNPMLTVELTLLLFSNIYSFIFISTLNKSLRFTRFRRSYVNYTAVIVINYCQGYTASYHDGRCSKWPRSFFCSRLSQMIVHLHNLLFLSTPVALMLSTPRWASKRKDVK